MSITKEELQKQFKKFLDSYNVREHVAVWQKQSDVFRDFWKNKILNDNISEIPKLDMDLIIKILDWRGAGSGEFRRKGGESVADVQAVKGSRGWYKIFRDLKEQKDIQEILNSILNTMDDKERVELINKFRVANQINKNCLTGENACTLNALLFASNPDSYLCVVSLKHRLMIIKYFELSGMANYDNYSYGEKIIQTNNFIINGFKEKYGIDVSPRTLTQFLYEVKEIKDFWQNKSRVKENKSTEKETHVGEQSGRNKSIPEIRSTLISPEDLYRDKYNFINILKSRTNYIHWMDNYFSKIGFQYLSQFIEEMEKEKVEEIYVITASNNKGINKFFVDDYELLKTTMSNKGIDFQIKVIDKSPVHDRFIINEQTAYNVPSTDIINKGSVSEVLESPNREFLERKFQELWKKSEDLSIAYKKILNYRKLY